MSLFGSLYTSVSGLQAQSQATSVISNNIANVNTVGFKRGEATFSALVTVESRAARYSPGAVQMNRFQRVDQQGQVFQTTSTTDVSINGDGFFVTRDFNDLDIEGEFRYTRNGQFYEDDEGILVNTAGQYLYGWEMDSRDADPNMEPMNTVFNADLSSLVPIDVSLANGLSRLTTEGALSINLDADQADDTQLLQDDPGLENLIPYVQDFDNDYSRTLRVYDSLGSGQDVTFQFTKVYGPQAVNVGTTTNLVVDDLLEDISPGIAGNDLTIDIAGGGVATYTITATSTVGEVIDFVNTYGTGREANAFLNKEGNLVVTGVGFTVADTLTLGDTGGAFNTLFGITTGTLTPTGTLPPNNTDGTLPDVLIGPTSPPPAQYNAGGWWQVNIIGPSPTIPLVEGLLNFNADGSLNAAQDVDGNIDIELSNVNWGNFSEPHSFNVDIEGMTQYAGLYNVAFATQNGASLGLKTGVEIDDEGYVSARFSNGMLSRLYKLPIASFASPENLQEISGTAYAETSESGQVLLNQAGESESGTLEGSTLEQSNVDLADEFTKLIVTQRAYSANTRVITTVDQMTEDLLRLR